MFSRRKLANLLPPLLAAGKVIKMIIIIVHGRV
jgi:hypothetical protein